MDKTLDRSWESQLIEMLARISRRSVIVRDHAYADHARYAAARCELIDAVQDLFHWVMDRDMTGEEVDAYCKLRLEKQWDEQCAHNETTY